MPLIILPECVKIMN